MMEKNERGKKNMEVERKAASPVLGSCTGAFPGHVSSFHRIPGMLQVQSLQSLFVLYLLKICYLATGKEKNSI